MAVLTAPACLTTIANVVFQEFGIALDEQKAAGSSARRAATDLVPSKRRSLRRNDRCWCGSGKKLKRCHGS
jgi:uncharacterized protein YecA (UPF0149 family)